MRGGGEQIASSFLICEDGTDESAFLAAFLGGSRESVSAQAPEQCLGTAGCYPPPQALAVPTRPPVLRTLRPGDSAALGTCGPKAALLLPPPQCSLNV